MAGNEFVDNGNGRDARATEVTFENEDGLAVFEWMSEMNESGLAENTGRPEGNINHYLAVGNKTSAMTADTSAALGTVFAVLGSGQFPGVELGVAPLPGLPGDGATFVGGGANYIVKGDDPAQDRSRVAVRQVPRRAQLAGDVVGVRLHPDPPIGDRHARGADNCGRASRSTRSPSTSSPPTTPPWPRGDR